MMRFGVVSILGLFSVAACSAGQIQLGGVNGLTSAYINQTAGAGQNACAAGAGNCLAGSVSNFSERNFYSVLFQSAVGTSSPYSTYNQGTAEQGTLGIFSMINDGTVGGSSKNYWDATAGNASITVPVGINDVTDVWTMLNNVQGAIGGTDTTVTFDFGTSSNASSFNDVVVFTLTNSGGEGATASGQIGSSVECTSSPCANDNGPVAGSSSASATLNGGSATASTVLTDILYSSTYTSIGGSVYDGSSGSIVLNGQDFNLAQFVAPSSGEYLVNMIVSEASGSTGLDGLTAVTVDTTPEPSTVLLFLTGLGAVGMARLRRK